MSTSKKIVITGVSRGCGRALAEWYLAQGHTVIGCARSEPKLRDLRASASRGSRFDVVDVADAEAVSRWAEEVLVGSGAPDLLINNAAIAPELAPLWKVPAAEVNTALGVNIGGTINTIRAFVPGMISEGRGVIVNFSSGWGRSTSPEVAVYCATKFAIEGLTQALAQELPRGMAAIALNPGIIDTEMLRTCFGAGAASYPDPQQWVKQAAPFLLRLTPRENGRSLDVPGIPTE